MLRDDIVERLNEVFREVFDDETIQISDETVAADIEDWDSLEHINLILAVEKCFGIKFNMGEAVSMKNVGEVLKAAGVSYDNVVKTTCFLAEMADFAAFNEVYAKYFIEKPARSCVAVKTLPKNVLCEIEAIAEA